MRCDLFTKAALALITLFLAAIALRPLFDPAPSFAQASSPDIYIEPGVHSLSAPDGSRQQLGKVVVDLKTGNIWGFPTGVNAPYPMVVDGKPPTSRPFLLGRFDLAAMRQ